MRGFVVSAHGSLARAKLNCRNPVGWRARRRGDAHSRSPSPIAKQTAAEAEALCVTIRSTTIAIALVLCGVALMLAPHGRATHASFGASVPAQRSGSDKPASLAELSVPVGFERSGRCHATAGSQGTCFLRLPSVTLDLSRFDTWLAQMGLTAEHTGVSFQEAQCSTRDPRPLTQPSLRLATCFGLATRGSSEFLVSVNSLLLTSQRSGVEGTSSSIGAGATKLQGTQITVSDLGVPSAQAADAPGGG
jgi:hypothetical protein